MDAILRSEHRRQAQARRRPPQQPERAFFPSAGGGERPHMGSTGPIELIIAATDSNGEPVLWLTDAWWIDNVQLWKDRSVTVHLLATIDSLWNPVILHQLNMLKRVVPQWKVVAEGYVGDIRGSERLEHLALSPYDDVRLVDGHRPGSPIGLTSMTLAEVCSRIREIQAKHQITRPIVSALACPTPIPDQLPPVGHEPGWAADDAAGSIGTPAAV